MSKCENCEGRGSVVSNEFVSRAGCNLLVSKTCDNCNGTGIEPKEEVMTGVKAVSILKEQVYKFNSQKIILTQTEALHLLNYIDVLKIKIKE